MGILETNNSLIILWFWNPDTAILQECTTVLYYLYSTVCQFESDIGLKSIYPRRIKADIISI